MTNSYWQTEDGSYLPCIPEPFWVRHWLFWSRPGCYQCRKKFRNRSEWSLHYLQVHSFEEER